MNFNGIIIGAAVFLSIGICHPLVIKMEYYWGTKYWWTWLLAGLIPLAGWFLVLSWLFQKGSYEEYMWRLKKAGPATFEEKRKEMERPRGGGWFFVALPPRRTSFRLPVPG